MKTLQQLEAERVRLNDERASMLKNFAGYKKASIPTDTKLEVINQYAEVADRLVEGLEFYAKQAHLIGLTNTTAQAILTELGKEADHADV